MGGGGPITHRDKIEHSVNGEEYENLYDNNGLDGTGSYGFTPERQGIFHYCVFAHDSDASTSTKKKTGNGDTPGDEFVLYDANLDSSNEQIKAFLHELGHNLLGKDKPGSTSHNPKGTHLDSNGHHDNSNCAMVKGHYDDPPLTYCGKCWGAIKLDWCF
jgi:hypothetical protein